MDDGDQAVVYFGEPIFSGVRAHQAGDLVNMTSLEHERREQDHPEFRRKFGIE